MENKAKSLKELHLLMIDQLQRRGFYPKDENEIFMRIVEEVGEVAEALREEQDLKKIGGEVVDILWNVMRLCELKEINLTSVVLDEIQSDIVSSSISLQDLHLVIINQLCQQGYYTNNENKLLLHLVSSTGKLAEIICEQHDIKTLGIRIADIFRKIINLCELKKINLTISFLDKVAFNETRPVPKQGWKGGRGLAALTD